MNGSRSTCATRQHDVTTCETLVAGMRRLARLSALAACLALVGCSGGGDAAGDSGGPGGSDPPGAADPSNPSSWLLNDTVRSTEIFETSAQQEGVLEDVQSVTEEDVDGVEYALVQTSNVPGYTVEMTQELVDELNARPRAATDFTSGATTASAGEIVAFGQDIGYVSTHADCQETGGYGYWPPGPHCPEDQDLEAYITTAPTPNDAECETGLGRVGLYVNGANVFNWNDGTTYADTWHNLAPEQEVYDVDVCEGHANQGSQYHHHSFSWCLGDLLGDDGADHSPIYGFAADGYPLYGPYESAGVLALSGWQTRDYGASAEAGGCGTPGERTCVLVDEYDLAKGVDSSVSQGLDVGAAVTTQSGNPVTADDGYFYEDWYWAGAPGGGAQLDEHNGHDNGDGRGYHYHLTVESDGAGGFSARFPYSVGPRFYGELPANAMARCGN